MLRLAPLGPFDERLLQLVDLASFISVAPLERLLGEIVRPEKLRIVQASDDAGDNVMPMTMRRRSFMGSSVDLAVEDPAGSEILLKLSATSTDVPAAGDAIVVAFRPEDCLCFLATAA